MVGVTKLVPVPIGMPPVGASYQFTVDALVDAPSVTVPIPQRDPGVVPLSAGELIVTVTTLDGELLRLQTVSCI